MFLTFIRTEDVAWIKWEISLTLQNTSSWIWLLLTTASEGYAMQCKKKKCKRVTFLVRVNSKMCGSFYRWTIGGIEHYIMFRERRIRMLYLNRIMNDMKSTTCTSRGGTANAFQTWTVLYQSPIVLSVNWSFISSRPAPHEGGQQINQFNTMFYRCSIVKILWHIKNKNGY